MHFFCADELVALQAALVVVLPFLPRLRLYLRRMYDTVRACFA